jgi:hypothetical protein
MYACVFLLVSVYVCVSRHQIAIIEPASDTAHSLTCLSARSCSCSSSGMDGYSQRIFICFKKENTVLSNPRACDEANDFLALPWYFDVRGDFTIEEYHFTRTPFVAVADVGSLSFFFFFFFLYPGSRLCAVVALHVFSQFPMRVFLWFLSLCIVALSLSSLYLGLCFSPLPTRCD